MARLADAVQDERTARMALSMIADPGDVTTGRVLALVGAAETVRLLESRDTVPFLSKVDAMIWREHHAGRITTRIPVALDQARQVGYGVLIPTDTDWPAGGNDLTDRTLYVLWTLGNETLLNRPTRNLVTITGTRAATYYGAHTAGNFARDFALNGSVVVAGGAYEIGTAAHRGVLTSGGDTIAVLAGGVGRLYPRGNTELLERIADTGLLISEALPGALPTRKRFLSRNRLEAAVLGATVVVESGARSNSLATAHRAHGLGRVVGAVPGPVTSPSSAGPHQLITDGRAMLTSDARQWLVGTGPCERWVHDGSATAARPCVRPGTVPRLARVRCHE